MEAVREYLFSITGAAVLCGIISTITAKNKYSGLLHLITGTFLIFTVISPLFRPEFISLPIPGEEILRDAQNVVLEGVDYAAQARKRIIKEQLEAYILDKASGLEARIVPEISLTDDTPPVPESVVISGFWSARARVRLETILEQELGIPKERQIWMDSNSG